MAQIAAIAALKHARRPDFTISGREVTIHPVTHREAVPLQINFMPIMTTFALFDSGAVVLIDPSAQVRFACGLDLALLSYQIVESGSLGLFFRLLGAGGSGNGWEGSCCHE